LTKGKAFIDYTLPDEEFRYGRANRPPTPINYVMGTNNIERNFIFNEKFIKGL